jgi:hypothetical protein
LLLVQIESDYIWDFEVHLHNHSSARKEHSLLASTQA